jgi:hypothetical protein
MVNLTIFVINLLKLVHKQDFAIILPNGINGTARFKKSKQCFEYRDLLLLKDIWGSKLYSIGLFTRPISERDFAVS